MQVSQHLNRLDEERINRKQSENSDSIVLAKKIHNAKEILLEKLIDRKENFNSPEYMEYLVSIEKAYKERKFWYTKKLKE